MRFCSKCGAQLEDDSRFCASCGAENTVPTYAGQPQNAAYQQQNGAYQQQNAYQQPNNAQQGGYNAQGVPPMGTPYGTPNQGSFMDKVKQLLFGTTEYQMDPQDVAANKTVGIISCFWILFFVPLCANGSSVYNRFKANQSLWVLITNAGLGIVFAILSLIVNAIFPPIKETFYGYTYAYHPNAVAVIFNVIFGIVCYGSALFLWVMNLVYAIQGRAKELPIVGKIRIIK
ncbi:MAG: zinc-ribbon domain-containing protein [Acutalibacteraceae bacterium]